MDEMQGSRKERLEVLYREQHDNIVHYIYRKILNWDDAEDIAQDVFMSCCRYIDRYNEEKCSLSAWMYVIANNRLKNYYRDKKVHLDIDQYSELLPDKDMDLERQAVYLQMCRDMAADALAGLSERSRQVVILTYFKQHSSKEISAELGISPGNVRVILNRALNKMQKILDNDQRKWKEQ